MSVSIGTLAMAMLAGLGLLALGHRAYQQNVPLLRALRTGTRDVKSMLRQVFIVWSPMAVVMVFLLMAASAISLAMTELVYRYTTLDEFCEVQGADFPLYVACTGMGTELAADKIRPLDAATDIDRQLFDRYGDTRKRLLQTPIEQLRREAKNPSAFTKTFLPAGVLGLPPVSEDDPELSRLVNERRRLLQSPIPNPTDVVEVLSYRQSVDNRNRMLLDMDARIAARRKVLHELEYGHLTPGQKLLHDRRKQILLLLKQVEITIDPDIRTGLLAPPGDTSGSDDFIRTGLVRLLATSERKAREILSREIGVSVAAQDVYKVLGMVPQCTLATENTTVRLASDDFDAGFFNESARFTTENSGSFPCFSGHEAASGIRLLSLGFRKSVLLSIDRLRDEAAFDAFRKLDTLELNATTGATLAKSSVDEVAGAVPAELHLGRQDCGLTHPLNCIANGLAASAEAAYTRSRNELASRRNGDFGARVDTSAMTIRQSIDHARVNVDAEVEQMHAAAYEAAASLFKFNDLLGVMGWIALLLIAARSFLYVLALELFDRDGELKITFDVENPVQGDFVSGPEIIIDRGFGIPIINRGSLTNTLADIKFAPWKWSAPLARILNGRYFFYNWSVFSPSSRADGNAQANGMEASARSGFSIVEWRMRPGEEVIFNYRDFYGASANVQLKTELSLRLSTLLLGKVFFHYARCVGCEGRLLLEARVHNATQSNVSSFKPSRMVAWNRHAQFTADSHRKPWKTFINPYTIVRESKPESVNGLVIIAPESESPHFFGAGMQSIKRFFSRVF